MKNKIKKQLRACALPACLAALTLLPAAAVQAAPQHLANGDPARWYQNDDAPHARLRNLNIETAAAYVQALQECKALRGQQASACRRQAAAARKEDAARARRIYNDYKASAGKAAS